MLTTFKASIHRSEFCFYYKSPLTLLILLTGFTKIFGMQFVFFTYRKKNKNKKGIVRGQDSVPPPPKKTPKILTNTFSLLNACILTGPVVDLVLPIPS